MRRKVLRLVSILAPQLTGGFFHWLSIVGTDFADDPKEKSQH